MSEREQFEAWWNTTGRALCGCSLVPDHSSPNQVMAARGFGAGFAAGFEAARAQPAQAGQGTKVKEPHFAPQEAITEDGWTEWVCPKPKGYLAQCCDCGLVHEIDTRVAKYEPRPSENFEVVTDPDLQVQWRVRRRDDLRQEIREIPAFEPDQTPDLEAGKSRFYSAQAGQVPPGYGSVWDILEAAMQAGVPDDKVQKLAEVLMQPEVKKSHFGPSPIGLVLSDDPLFVFAKEVIHGAYKPEELADAAMRAIRHHSAAQKSIVDAVLAKRVPMQQISDGEFAPDAKLLELADKIDHEQNWRHSGIFQRDHLTQDQKDRVLAGVMLRRYADLMAPESWRLFPPKSVVSHSYRAATLEAVVKMAERHGIVGEKGGA